MPLNYANALIFTVYAGAEPLFVSSTTSSVNVSVNQIRSKYRRWLAGEGPYREYYARISDVEKLRGVLLYKVACSSKAELNNMVARVEAGLSPLAPAETIDGRLEAARLSKRRVAPSTLCRYKATITNLMEGMATNNPNVFDDPDMVIDHIDSMVCSIDARRRAYKALSFVSAAESNALADYSAAAAAAAASD